MSQNQPPAVKIHPAFLFRNQADTEYGNAVTGELQTLGFESEMADLADKMILELMTLFDDHEIELDFSQESLEELDLLADRVWPDPIEEDEVLDAIVANWGAYLARVITENLGGTFTFRKDIEHVSVFFPRTDLEAFPMHIVRKRFHLGAGESLGDFYQTLVDRLVEN